MILIIKKNNINWQRGAHLLRYYYYFCFNSADFQIKLNFEIKKNTKFQQQQQKESEKTKKKLN